MKLVFLDCDGVLNNHDFPVVDPEFRREGGWRYQMTKLDDLMVARAVRTLKRADAHLVISSIWQTCHMVPLRRKLDLFGFNTQRILGGTDDLRPGGRHFSRGELMLLWIEKLPEVTHWGAWDDSNVPEIEDRLIQTKSHIGLEQKHCHAMLELLGINDDAIC